MDNFTPGHVNLSFYGKDGSYQGTYGANHAGDLHGILEETETNKVRMSKGSAWYSQTFLSVEEAQFQKALNYARTSVKRTLDKEIGYQLIGGNCVDFATQALCMVNEDLHGYLKDLSALKAYSKLRGASCPVDKSTRQRRSLQQNVDELERLYGVKILPVNVSSIGYPRVFYTDFRHVDDCYATPRYNRRSGPVDKPSNYSWDVVKEFVLTFGTNCPVTRKYVAQNLPIVSPIVINLDGKGIVTKSIFDSNVQFDFDGSGEKYFTGWITKGSGFLFWDPEGDNMIRDASKMFGGGQAGEGFKSWPSWTRTRTASSITRTRLSSSSRCGSTTMKTELPIPRKSTPWRNWASKRSRWTTPPSILRTNTTTSLASGPTPSSTDNGGKCPTSISNTIKAR